MSNLDLVLKGGTVFLPDGRTTTDIGIGAKGNLNFRTGTSSYTQRPVSYTHLRAHET